VLAAYSFPSIFGLALLNGLPLHIARVILSSAGKWDDMVDHISLARAFIEIGGWTGIQLEEGGTVCRIPRGLAYFVRVVAT
jgi:hypothetical protein